MIVQVIQGGLNSFKLLEVEASLESISEILKIPSELANELSILLKINNLVLATNIDSHNAYITEYVYNGYLKTGGSIMGVGNIERMRSNINFAKNKDAPYVIFMLEESSDKEEDGTIFYDVRVSVGHSEDYNVFARKGIIDKILIDLDS